MRTVPREIRLYCLCGLKMRITADMYGKPGKCISCRQRFWVPTPEELPEDDNILRLVNHPELLRRAGDRVRKDAHGPGKDVPSAPGFQYPEVMPEMASKDSVSGSGSLARLSAEDRLAAGSGDAVSAAEAEEPTAPLDDLEPLRQILAYRYLMECQAQDAAAKKTNNSVDTDTRLAYRRVIERARNKVEQRLRELLFDTGRRLVEVFGEIAQTTLRFRVGEIGPDAYFEAVGKLRQRREWLDRQRVNMKNWLRTEDVYLLGGPEGVTLEDMNLNRVEVFLPAEDQEDRPLLKKYIDEMREAFDARSVAERRRSEWRRMVREGEMHAEALREGPLQAAADTQRARARIVHCRVRLRQVVRDCDTDLSALQAYRQLLAKGALPRSRGEVTQEEVLNEARMVSRALADLRLWRNWAYNATNAEEPGDLPLSPPTLFRRLAEPNELRRFALESVPAYAAALCLMLLALMPLAMARAGFLAGMMFMVIVPASSSRLRRGAIYVAVWVIETFLMGLACHLSEADPAARSYLSNPVHLAVMVAAALGAWTAMGVCATLVLRKAAGGYVWVPPAAGAAGILLFLAAVFLGSSPAPSPQPASTPAITAVTPPPAAGTSAENVTKTGNPVPTAPPPLPPVAVAPKPAPATSASPAIVPVKTVMPTATPVSPLPSATAALPPTAATPPRNSPESATPQEVAAPPGADAAQSSADATTAASAPIATTVELRGVMQKEGDPPRFRIVLNAPGGRNRTMDIMLGETVYGPWIALEYSATSKKLTLSNTKRMVVLDTGQKVELSE